MVDDNGYQIYTDKWSSGLFNEREPTPANISIQYRLNPHLLPLNKVFIKRAGYIFL